MKFSKPIVVVYALVLVMSVFFVSGIAMGWEPEEEEIIAKVAEIAKANENKWSLEEAAKPYSGVTLRILADAATEADEPQKYDEEFTKLTGIKVIWEQFPWDELRSKAFLDFTSRTGAYDLVWLPFDDMASAVQNGYIQPITNFLTNPALLDPEIHLEDYSEMLWKYTSWYGNPRQPYGFPCENPTMILWYRKDLFENPEEKANFREIYRYDLQVPKNFIQYYNIAEFFTRKKGEKLAGEVLEQDFYGVGIHGKKHSATVLDWMNFAASWSNPTWGGILDEMDNIVVNSPENVEALEYWVSLFRFAPAGCVDWYWDQLTTAFQQGICAMAIAWNDQSYEIEDPEKSKVAGRMGYDLIPVQKHKVSNFGAWSWTMSAATKNPEAAWLYLQWVTSRKISLECGKSGAMPARKYVFDDPVISAIPFMPATKEALEICFARPVHRPEWPQMEEALALYLTKAHREEISAQEALDAVALEFQRLLGTQLVYPPKNQ